MRLSDYALKLLALAGTISRWSGAMSGLDLARRERVARFAERVADTLARAGQALHRLDKSPHNGAALAAAAREFGRIQGYVETLVDALRHHLDGRKIAGIKRRLEQLDETELTGDWQAGGLRLQIDRLAAAEGYFRALADALRS